MPKESNNKEEIQKYFQVLRHWETLTDFEKHLRTLNAESTGHPNSFAVPDAYISSSKTEVKKWILFLILFCVLGSKIVSLTER